jgi:glycosyltransferase involved in cell wall biosynthesis
MAFQPPMPAPDVSVLIPSYNRAELLRAAIASVLKQSFHDFELIVVDDGSTDHTQEVVESFNGERLSYVRVEHCGNLSALRNAGIRCANGSLIAFLDSDDLWRQDKLAVQLQLLEANPEAGFAISGYEVFRNSRIERTKLYGQDGGVSVRSIFDDLIRGRITLCSSSILIRSQLLERAGALDEGLRTGDYEFYTRLAWHSIAGIVHEPLVSVRKHEGNSSREFDAEGLQEAIAAVVRFYRMGVIGRELRNDRLLKYRYELSQILFRRGDIAGARREILACIRLSPARVKHWQAYARFLRGRGNLETQSPH